MRDALTEKFIWKKIKIIIFFSLMIIPKKFSKTYFFFMLKKNGVPSHYSAGIQAGDNLNQQFWIEFLPV